jgi:hypothetical protein
LTSPFSFRAISRSISGPGGSTICPSEQVPFRSDGPSGGIPGAGSGLGGA